MGRGKSQKTLDLIAAAREILAEIHPATVRAVCYRLFTMGLIESMAKSETNRVGTQLTWAREHDEIPWEWVVDETRDAENYRGGWKNPEAFLRAASVSYRRDFWAYQSVHVEVWSEKGTVRGTLAPVLEGYGVTFRVMHGYGSATAVHQVAELSAQDEKPWRIFYVGDWDPSGLHMSEVDLPTRLTRYGADGESEASVARAAKLVGVSVDNVRRAAWLKRIAPDLREEVFHGRLSLEQAERLAKTRGDCVELQGRVRLARVALTTADISQGALPPFDADTKRDDPRWRWYVGRYGRRCWELDALNPVVLRQRVETAIRSQIETEAWERCRLGETAEQTSIRQVLETCSQSISRQASKYRAD